MLRDKPYSTDSKRTYECYDCGTTVTVRQAPGECPNCGAAMRNCKLPLE